MIDPAISSSSTRPSTSVMRPPSPSLLAESKAALDAFRTSSKRFRIIRTIPDSHRHPDTSSPRILFILDSSFNPPSIAHLALATSALSSTDTHRYPPPNRLLLLFSTHNADKAGGTPAAFEHRLAMMICFAQDLVDRQQQRSGKVDSQEGSPGNEDSVLAVDVGLTDQPYYNDKSAAIDETEPQPYPSKPMHIHLTGYDTFTRIFTAKYYPKHDPPFSALAPFFERHGLRVMIRADEEQGRDERGEWGGPEAQKDKVLALGRGELEEEGGKKEWGDKLEWIDDEGEGAGVSSTRVRKAVGSEKWDVVERLCTSRVSWWIREMGLYKEEEKGAEVAQKVESKMA